ERKHCGPAVLGIVEQDAGFLASGIAICRQHRLEAHAGVRRLRIGVGHGAGGTDSRAAAAAGAQVRLDLDEVALRLDRPARADIQAEIAALAPRAAVRAYARVVREEPRLLEFADQTR